MKLARVKFDSEPFSNNFAFALNLDLEITIH